MYLYSIGHHGAFETCSSTLWHAVKFSQDDFEKLCAEVLPSVLLRFPALLGNDSIKLAEVQGTLIKALCDKHGFKHIEYAAEIMMDNFDTPCTDQEKRIQAIFDEAQQSALRQLKKDQQ